MCSKFTHQNNASSKLLLTCATPRVSSAFQEVLRALAARFSSLDHIQAVKTKKNINFNSYKLRALILYRVEEGGVRPPSNAHIFIWFERKIINATQLYNKIFKILIRVPMLIGKFRTIIILITKKVKHS